MKKREKKNKEKIKFKDRIKKLLYDIYKFVIDWRMAISFVIAWMITNGWAYIFIGVGTFLEMKWMSAIGAGYVAILWLPCTPEKLITIPLSVFIKKLLFRKHTKNEEEKKELVNNGYNSND